MQTLRAMRMMTAAVNIQWWQQSCQHWQNALDNVGSRNSHQRSLAQCSQQDEHSVNPVNQCIKSTLFLAQKISTVTALHLKTRLTILIYKTRVLS